MIASCIWRGVFAWLAIVPNVLVVNPGVPVNTVKELAEYIRARPGQVNYGSSGNGTSNHLAGAMFV